MTPYEAEKFRNNLFELINTSNLTLSSAFYILKDVFNTFEKQYMEQSLIAPKQEEKPLEITYSEEKSLNQNYQKGEENCE